MINATLRMTRVSDDGAEMYRKYFIVADFGVIRGQGKFSIIPMSQGAPMPESERMTVKGGEQEALLAAIESLKSLAGNEGFSAELSLDPTN